nr:MAG TPA: hypothetical protein [Bacteriophage sp.]
MGLFSSYHNRIVMTISIITLIISIVALCVSIAAYNASKGK